MDEWMDGGRVVICIIWVLGGNGRSCILSLSRTAKRRIGWVTLFGSFSLVHMYVMQ